MSGFVGILNRLITEFSTLGVPMATIGFMILALAMTAMPYFPSWLQGMKGGLLTVGGGLFLLGIAPTLVTVITALK